MRHRRGLTLEQVAEALRVRPSTVSRWERTLTAPSADERERLCALLHAAPEECAALQDACGLLTGKEIVSLDALQHRLDVLAIQVCCDTLPLGDLRFLTLEAQMAAARKEGGESARWLLAHALFWHAKWLSRKGRWAESEARALESEAGMDACGICDADRLEDVLLIALARNKIGAHPNPRVGLRILNDFLPRVKGSYRTHFYRDMATYACQAGLHTEALRLIREARAVALKAEHEVALHLARHVRANVLVACGCPAEALFLLSDLEGGDPLVRVLREFTRIEALLALGANAEADAALRPVLALIDAYDLTHLRPHANRLATRL